MAPDNSKTSGKTNGAAAARKAEMSSAAAEKAAAPGRELSDWVKIGVAAYCLFVVAKAAYQIRLGAINEFGPVIHEFDPYFNYRATEYLYWNGARRFFQWFDHKVWYPLGRPVGTTIYPGMQFTAVWIKEYLPTGMSLNDICCYIPAWFGIAATLITGLIAYECSVPANSSSNLLQFALDILAGKKSPVDPSKFPDRNLLIGLVWSPAVWCGVASAAFMSIVPAHLMRSMGGGYDNESVAITAMVLTFYYWVRSLRATDHYSHWWGIATGLAYFYMVAAWGGYVFVINLIGVHAAVLVGLGRFNYKIYMAYSLFYVIGTALAIQVPVVGWTPLKSLEQLGPCVVFLGYQALMFCEVIRNRQNLSRREAWMLRIKVAGVTAGVLLGITFMLAPTGYFGPISSRVRGLFVKHTKTGNPLVDSVAEHQPASSRAYFQYLHHVCSLAPVGYMIVMFKLSDSSSFLIVWGSAAYFFSHKMVRLVLLTAPIGSVLGGIAAGRVFAWCVHQWWESQEQESSLSEEVEDEMKEDTSTGGKKSKASKARKAAKKTAAPAKANSSFQGLVALQEAADKFGKSKEGIMAKRTLAAVGLLLGYMLGTSFVSYSWRLSKDLSNPTIIQKARRRDGTIIQLDDYREAYWWLRDNTPEDARVMAWWDYGYQISAIANRTTIADGNTWNHEHIALLGKALTTELEEGWEIARHLADYVLIWGGGGGDDLAKSPHLARIANSVYRDHCPDDPTCRAFGFIDRQGTPSAMMRRSLLYILHGHDIKPDVKAPEDRFQEVYRSTYGKVRIFKIIGVSEESKKWCDDPANWHCDVPGSWFCPGSYPPGLNTILARKKDFKQLEDFNRGGDADHEYQQQYFKDLHDPESARRKILEKERKERLQQRDEGLSEAEKKEQTKKIDEIYNTWADTEETTMMWRLISSSDVDGLKRWLEVEPHKAFVRSKDGRGPMWWAFEQRNEEVTKLLMKAGVPHTDKDAKGLTPVDLLEGRTM